MSEYIVDEDECRHGFYRVFRVVPVGGPASVHKAWIPVSGNLHRDYDDAEAELNNILQSSATQRI